MTAEEETRLEALRLAVKMYTDGKLNITYIGDQAKKFEDYLVTGKIR